MVGGPALAANKRGEFRDDERFERGEVLAFVQRDAVEIEVALEPVRRTVRQSEAACQASGSSGK